VRRRLPADPAPGRRLFWFDVFVALDLGAMASVGFLAPLCATELGAGPGIVGVLMSVAALGSLVAAIPAGVLVQRAGTLRPMMIACAMSGVAMVGVVASYSLAMLFVSLTLYRIAEIVTFVAFQTHVGAASADSDRTTADFGWYAFAVAIGQFLGPAGAGALAGRIGFRWAWAATAGLFLLFSALTPVLVRWNTPGVARERVEGMRVMRRIFGDGGFRSFLSPVSLVAIAASFTVVFATGCRDTYFPVYLTSLGLGASVAGLLVAVASVSGIVSRLTLSSLVRFAGGPFPTMLWCFLVVGIGVGSTSFFASVPVLAANSLVVGLGTGISMPVSMTIVARNVSPDSRAVAMSVRLMGNRLASFVNPLVFGTVAAAGGIPAAFVAAGVVMLAFTAGLFTWWRSRGAAEFDGPGP
jgi:MFS family permease